ncbi:MAG: NAD(P)/FAD-dependent oxidoreductase [Rhizobiaceae bacterium]
MALETECLVIGAGVIGLAVALALAQSGREVIVLEAETAIGTGISSRNSEVIHAGIYYPSDSLKARYCVRGRDLLYLYCENRGIRHRRLGKLIVAQDENEARTLGDLAAQAQENGVNDIEQLDRRQAVSLEPALNAHSALWSPSTGIVDSHDLMLSLQGEAEDRGAVVVFGAPVIGGTVGGDAVRILVGGREPVTLSARFVVNAAGLEATRLACRFEGLATPPPPMKFAKGNYFSLSAKAPFSRLIYPVPEPGGLGVHLTLDLAGRARFGPDVEWIEEFDFAVDPQRAEPFYRAIRRYWPDLPEASLYPDYAGIRPKASGAADFVIDAASGNLVSLYGIESPGLTSCLAIAEDLAAIAAQRLGR